MNKTVTDFTWDDYQKIINETAVYPNKGRNMWYPALGLAGEAGEVAEKVKKFYRDGIMKVTKLDQSFRDASTIDEQEYIKNQARDEFKRTLSRELGDVLWYVTAIAEEQGIRLEDIARENYDKLIKRRETNTLHGSGDDREQTK